MKDNQGITILLIALVLAILFCVLLPALGVISWDDAQLFGDSIRNAF